MNKSKILFFCIIIFSILIPWYNFNFDKDAKSMIDNTYLPKLESGKKLTSKGIDNYLSMRMGFRENAITNYLWLNDYIFGEMTHPTYCYGQDGYVFFKVRRPQIDEKFISAFARYLSRVQAYCDERNIKFLYCINPSKTTVYNKYLPKGFKYENKFYDVFYKELDKYNVNYVSNKEYLTKLALDKQIYNKKYDAGHWNDLGQFYGTNNMYKALQKDFSMISLNKIEDFNIDQQLETSLPVSKFEISELVPRFQYKYDDVINITNNFKDIDLHKNFRAFQCYEKNNAEDLPRVLFFHGSYYNRNRDFYKGAFKETYAVHNYQNFLNLDYYLNVFKPDCVLLETAEYATGRSYFDYSKLANKKFNKPYVTQQHIKHTRVYKSNVNQSEEIRNFKIIGGDNSNLVTIKFNTNKKFSYGYLVAGYFEFDLSIADKVVSCTLDKNNFDENNFYLCLFE